MTQDLTLMTSLTKKMDWDEQRQKVIAQNIANADTPHYMAQDLTPLNFKELLGSSASKLPMTASSGLTTTNPKHITVGNTSGSGGNATEKNQKNPYETSPSGNAVILEEQTLKLSQNVADHEFMTNLYQRQVQFLKESTK